LDIVASLLLALSLVAARVNFYPEREAALNPKAAGRVKKGLVFGGITEQNMNNAPSQRPAGSDGASVV
jgi:hypothetical protein